VPVDKKSLDDTFDGACFRFRSLNYILVQCDVGASLIRLVYQQCKSVSTSVESINGPSCSFCHKKYFRNCCYTNDYFKETSEASINIYGHTSLIRFENSVDSLIIFI
jgi:hypothetical protein